MRSLLFGRFLSAVILSSGMVPAMHGAVQNRIAGGVGSATVVLPQSVPPRASRATDLGEASGNTALPSMTLRFSMTAAQQAALTQLLEDQQNPASPQYHQWLTPEQFAARFGLSSGDVAKVSQWLTSQGFKITATARSSTFIQFSGTVAQAEAAFKTSIHRLSIPVEANVGGQSEEHIANVTEASLPSGIAGVVAAISGLDDFKLKPRVRARMVQASANPKFTSSISGDNFLAPSDFATIYDTQPLLSSSIDGAGLTIAIAGQTDIALSDVTAFRAAAGLSTNLPTVKLYGSDPGTSSTDLPEADLDVEWSGAVAPSASILYVNSSDVVTSLTDIIDNKLAPIASISYGECESQTGAPQLISLNQLFMQANAQGMTVVGPGGDSGATDCDYQVSIATQGLAVDFPASSPYVTGAGGSQFNEGTGTYWNTTNNADGGSAISYIPEAVWNETAEDDELGAGGGGASSFFTKPSWQTGTGVPDDFARDVPDIALNASADHDGYLFCSAGSCVNGFRTSAAATADCPTGNCLDVVGGTSAGTPSFAGILALIEQKIGSTTGVGNANPVIYALANSTYYGEDFHDITAGNNASPCEAGSIDCPSGGNIGYNAGVGYDQASGWGSVDAFNLANTWTLVTPNLSGSAGTDVSTTTLTESAASVTSGTSVTVTATVASGGTPSGGTATGTVQFLVDNVATGASVTLSSGVATYSLSTSALSSGTHTISAAYSGDSTYAGSIGSISLDVTSATAADFSLTPATATVTVAAGANASGLVYTVTPLNGFAGSVAFTAATSSATLNASYYFTVSPVAISSTAAGTTTLDLSAYVTNDARTGSGLMRLRPSGTASTVPSAGARPGLYAASGVALAGIALFMVPRRRRFGSLLGLALAAGALGGMLGLSGCGSGTSAIAATTNTTPGTYTITVTAIGTSTSGTQVSHSSTVTFVVQ